MPVTLTKGAAERDAGQLAFEKEQIKGEFGAPLRNRAEENNLQVLQNFDAAIDATGAEAGGYEGGDDSDDNNLYNKAVMIVRRDKKASISYVQRQLRIGYNRAATLIEKMEENGVVSAPNISGKREIIEE